MGKDLYVGNISFNATEEDIHKLFSLAGKVKSIHLMNDPKTGKFRGTGFVKMANVEAKEVAVLLDGTLLIDRVITVNEAQPPKDRQPPAVDDRVKSEADKVSRGKSDPARKVHGKSAPDRKVRGKGAPAGDGRQKRK